MSGKEIQSAMQIPFQDADAVPTSDSKQRNASLQPGEIEMDDLEGGVGLSMSREAIFGENILTDDPTSAYIPGHNSDDKAGATLSHPLRFFQLEC